MNLVKKFEMAMAAAAFAEENEHKAALEMLAAQPGIESKPGEVCPPTSPQPYRTLLAE